MVVIGLTDLSGFDEIDLIIFLFCNNAFIKSPIKDKTKVELPHSSLHLARFIKTNVN